MSEYKAKLAGAYMIVTRTSISFGKQGASGVFRVDEVGPKVETIKIDDIIIPRNFWKIDIEGKRVTVVEERDVLLVLEKNSAQ